MKARIFMLVSFCLCCYAAPGIAKPKAWAEYSSANFKIYTDEKPKRAEEILADFEKFRIAAIQFTRIPNRAENARMLIVMYSDKRDYRKIQSDDNVAGFFMNSWAGPRMIVGPSSRNMDSSVILFHEYVHYLLGEHSEIIYPKWYNEGFAEVLASAKIQKDKVIIGGVHPLRRNWLVYDRFLPVNQMLDPKEVSNRSTYWGRFYASSWAFVHYLQLGVNVGNQDYRQQTSDYLSRINKGEESASAFAAAFGMEARKMDSELRRYIERRSLMGISYMVGEYTDNISGRILSENERLYLLSDIAVLCGKEDIAMEYLQQLDPQKSDAARGQSLLAIIENHTEKSSAATAMASALKLAPNDPKVLANATHYYWDLLNQSKDEAVKEEAFNQVITLGEKTLELDSLNQEVHFFMWSLYAASGEKVNALKSMMAAYRGNSTNPALNFTIGSYLIDIGSPKHAPIFLERVVALTHDEEQAEQAQAMLENINKPTLSETEKNSAEVL